MTTKVKVMETDSVTGALNRTGFFHKVREILESEPEQDCHCLFQYSEI